MKTIHFIMIALMLYMITPIASAENPVVIDIAISPEGKSRQDVGPLIEKILLTTAPGDTINVYNAAMQTRVASITISSDVPEDATPAKTLWLGKVHGDDLRKIGLFLKSPLSPDVPGGQANIIQYIKSLPLRAVEFPNRPIRAIYIGSPIVTIPQYSLVNKYPSDSFLLAPDNLYSTVGKNTALRGIDLHILHSPGMSEFSTVDASIHHSRLQRFFGLFLAQQGGTLASFSGSADHLAKIKSAKYPNGQYGKPDNSDGKLRMTEIKTARMVQDEASQQMSLWANTITTNPPPPTIQTGPVELGLKWVGAIDYDLYTQARADQEISFAMPNSATFNGRLLQDIRSQQPGSNVFETIIYTGNVSINDLKVFINHYSGPTTGPIELEFRVRFNNKIYSKRFRMPAGQGSGGGGDRNTNPSWVKISVPSIMGLRI